MDGARFDHAVRSLRSRRRVAAALLGGLAAALARSAPVGAVDCLPNGETCNPATPEMCCTGTCKPHKGTNRCAPAGEAFGCTTSKATDICTTGAASACPDFPAGFCIVARTNRKRRPICLAAADCSFACTSDADCLDHFHGPLTIRCIKHCNLCPSTTSCVVPVTDS